MPLFCAILKKRNAKLFKLCFSQTVINHLLVLVKHSWIEYNKVRNFKKVMAKPLVLR